MCCCLLLTEDYFQLSVALWFWLVFHLFWYRYRMGKDLYKGCCGEGLGFGCVFPFSVCSLCVPCLFFFPSLLTSLLPSLPIVVERNTKEQTSLTRIDLPALLLGTKSLGIRLLQGGGPCPQARGASLSLSASTPKTLPEKILVSLVVTRAY